MHFNYKITLPLSPPPVYVTICLWKGDPQLTQLKCKLVLSAKYFDATKLTSVDFSVFAPSLCELDYKSVD